MAVLILIIFSHLHFRQLHDEYRNIVFHIAFLYAIYELKIIDFVYGLEYTEVLVLTNEIASNTCI